ncbi:MAG: response regulator transcription factor [Desulfobacteraceae bacterium]|nr:response regulator transcription factor [Desulfobacteraceae bacterium]
MRILVADDDTHLCETVKRGLEESSYAVDCVHDGEDAVYYAEVTPYDLIVLDIMMPEKDGFEVCRILRSKNFATPILMLTAKDTVEDRVKGLDTGADDYLIKPFAFPELLARIRALLRRDSVSKPVFLKVGDLVLDPVTMEVKFKEKLVNLTSKEFAILEFLMRHPNAVVTRTMIEQHAWDYDFDSISNIVDVYIRKIRQKIDPVSGKKIITTIRGAGYRINAL